MENRNNNQGRDDRNNGGMMDRIGETIENMVDTITGDNQDKGNQGKDQNKQER